MALPMQDEYVPVFLKEGFHYVRHYNVDDYETGIWFDISFLAQKQRLMRHIIWYNAVSDWA